MQSLNVQPKFRIVKYSVLTSVTPLCLLSQEVSLILLSPTLAALKYNLKSTLASRIALLANMPLAHIMGCSITANDSNQVSDF